jgi:hypothetical protein
METVPCPRRCAEFARACPNLLYLRTRLPMLSYACSLTRCNGAVVSAIWQWDILRRCPWCFAPALASLGCCVHWPRRSVSPPELAGHALHPVLARARHFGACWRITLYFFPNHVHPERRKRRLARLLSRRLRFLHSHPKIWQCRLTLTHSQ